MQLFAFTILNTCLEYYQILEKFIGKRVIEKWNSSQPITYLNTCANYSF